MRHPPKRAAPFISDRSMSHLTARCESSRRPVELPPESGNAFLERFDVTSLRLLEC